MNQDEHETMIKDENGGYSAMIKDENGGYSDEQHEYKEGRGSRREDEGSEPEQMRKLFIGGLNYKTTDESLKEYYEKWGKIVDVVVMKDPKTKRSRGFGFVTYSESSMVDVAMASRPHVVDGRTVEPKRAVRREDNGKPEANMTVKKIFIGGLKDDATDEVLREYFSQFGNVTTAVHVTEKGTDKKRGFGFVEFDDYDAVDKCCLLHDEHQINGKRIDVKKAISKEDMQKRSGRMDMDGGSPWTSGGPGGRMGGGGRDRDRGNWGRGGGDFGGRDFGGRSGGRGGGGGGRGNYGRDEGRYGGGSFGRGGDGGRGGWDEDDDGWNSGSRGGGSWGGSGGRDSYGGGNFDRGFRSGGGGRYSPEASFGDHYEQGYGGGPIRGGGSYGGGGSFGGGGGRSAPYGGGSGGGGGGYRRY